MQCRICGCSEFEPCPIGCGWAEPGLCDVCDGFIDALALAIGGFTNFSAAARPGPEHYTAAVNRALSEASGRLRQFHSADKPLIEVVGG